MLKLKQNCKYALVAPTSMGVRITPVNSQPVQTSTTFTMQATSAESNVLNLSASLGLNTLAMTTFVKDNTVAEFIKRSLRARNINYIGVDVPQGGPWGYRHQFNIADSGYGSRAPIVTNDRAGEVGRTLNVKDFDLEQIFARYGAQILHMSGLICALSRDTAEFCLQLARYAKANGTLISFDLNYRASFWVGREEELRATFDEIASVADILVGNEEDFQLALGIVGAQAGGKDLSSKIDTFKKMIKDASKKYPNVSLFATTLREVISANCHKWGAIVSDGVNAEVILPREIYVLDRIGGGDGFVAGLLYGLIRGWEIPRCAQFGWASGAYATTVSTDYAEPMNEKQIWSIYEGDARVKR